VRLLSYTASGDEHTVLTDGPFYSETVKGQWLIDASRSKALDRRR
jgi:hypothetical protein